MIVSICSNFQIQIMKLMKLLYYNNKIIKYLENNYTTKRLSQMKIMLSQKKIKLNVKKVYFPHRNRMHRI